MLPQISICCQPPSHPNQLRPISSAETIVACYRKLGPHFDVPVSSLPPFLGFLYSEKVGFLGPFVNEDKVYVARLIDVFESEKQTLKNSYNNIYNLVRTRLIEDKIFELINIHSKDIYIKKYY